MPKEIRFGELVMISGRPEIVSLWTDPKQDRAFMKAVKENRVLTLSQEPASKRKDFGRIGFHREPHAAYLIFPKPLPTKDAPRVIGIKYDLIEQRKVVDPVALSSAKAKPAKIPVPRRTRTFDVVIRRVAVIETSVSIDDVRSESEAKREALRSIKNEPFDFTKAVMRDEVLGVGKRRD